MNIIIWYLFIISWMDFYETLFTENYIFNFIIVVWRWFWIYFWLIVLFVYDVTNVLYCWSTSLSLWLCIFNCCWKYLWSFDFNVQMEERILWWYVSHIYYWRSKDSSCSTVVDGELGGVPDVNPLHRIVERKARNIRMWLFSSNIHLYLLCKKCNDVLLFLSNIHLFISLILLCQVTMNTFQHSPWLFHHLYYDWISILELVFCFVKHWCFYKRCSCTRVGKVWKRCLFYT